VAPTTPGPVKPAGPLCCGPGSISMTASIRRSSSTWSNPGPATGRAWRCRSVGARGSCCKPGADPAVRIAAGLCRRTGAGAALERVAPLTTSSASSPRKRGSSALRPQDPGFPLPTKGANTNRLERARGAPIPILTECATAP
jgi:hypothetical protein